MAAEGETLTVNTGSLADEDGLGDLSYQWIADNELINGATEDSFTFTQNEVGKAITVQVSYTDGYNTEEALTSDPTALVENDNANDDPTSTITIDGIAAEDEILTVNTSSLTEEQGLVTFSYQWLADGLIIEGANSDHFTLSQKEVGKLISVEVNFVDNQSDSISFNFDDTILPSGMEY